MPESMRTMVMEGAGKPLVQRDVPIPTPGPDEIWIAMSACDVCRTDLHIVDDKLTTPKPSLIPGRKVVGIIESRDRGVTTPIPGERVGVPWLGWTCGVCPYCLHGRGNLCNHPAFADYTRDGGYAQYAVCDTRYCLLIPARYNDVHAASLLCAGLIGYRTLCIAGNACRIDIYGFGTTAHLITQIAMAEQREVFAFTRTNDTAAQQLALDAGASWAGASDASAPEPLNTALVLAPVDTLVPQALQVVVKDGSVVCGGIHMSDIPAFPYRLLWEERKLVSVADLARTDGLALMRIAAEVPLRVHITPCPLQDANTALEGPRAGRVTGTAVLQMPPKGL